MSKKLAIFTAIFGGYDRLIIPIHADQLKLEADFFCFTDNTELRSDYFTIILVDAKHKDPQRSARFVKTKGYKSYLIDYMFALWVDSNLMIVADSFKGLIAEYGSNDIVVNIHSGRDCLYDEAKWVLGAKRDNPQTVKRHLRFLERRGFPKKFGLAATNFLLRRNNSNVQEFNDLWWRMIQTGSKRDQLSFDYCRWVFRGKLQVSYLPVQWDDNEYTVRLDHAKDYQSIHLYTLSDFIYHFGDKLWRFGGRVKRRFTRLIAQFK